MAITYDPAKREKTLRARRLDFDRAEEVLAGRTLDIPTRVVTTASDASIPWAAATVAW
jgi:uncharacterized DUF497 family protein